MEAKTVIMSVAVFDGESAGWYIGGGAASCSCLPTVRLCRSY
jgi:hypothetical protein